MQREVSHPDSGPLIGYAEMVRAFPGFGGVHWWRKQKTLRTRIGRLIQRVPGVRQPLVWKADVEAALRELVK